MFRSLLRPPRIVLEPLTMVELGRHATFWSTAQGAGPGVQIMGDFYVTNNGDTAVTITGVRLVRWRRVFHLIPRRQTFLGMTFDDSIPADTTIRQRLVWFVFPPFVERGESFPARVYLRDSRGETHHSAKVTWFDMQDFAQNMGRATRSK